MKYIFIAWTRYNRRSDMLAQHLDATMYHLAYGRHGDIWRAPLRYMVLSWRTWALLRRERPEVVFVQNPPIVCVLIAYLYARCCNARYVIDSHTAAFLSPKWRWSLWLHRLLSRGAVTTIVTNDHLCAVVRRWGCRVTKIGFTPAEYPDGEPFALEGAFNVAVISTGAEDEPLDLVFAAARRLPEVRFYVTGDARRVDPTVLTRRPDNCHMTGYLSYAQYVGLLRQANVVLDLTTRNHTLLLGAFEAVALGTPLIISDWPVLRDYFSDGTVHIPNTIEGVYAGVRQAQREQATLRAGILHLRDQLNTEWTHTFQEFQGLLASGR